MIDWTPLPGDISGASFRNLYLNEGSFKKFKIEGIQHLLITNLLCGLGVSSNLITVSQHSGALVYNNVPAQQMGRAWLREERALASQGDPVGFGPGDPLSSSPLLLLTTLSGEWWKFR